MESRYYCLFVTKVATSYDSLLANTNLGDCNRERKKGGRKKSDPDWGRCRGGRSTRGEDINELIVL